MMLIEETTVPDAALPVEQFKDHLRLGTGFSEDALQDSVLKGFLRAAMAAIEARTGKVLISRTFSWSLTAWRNRTDQALPIAPVIALSSAILTRPDGSESELFPGLLRLQHDSQRPCLRPVGATLPLVPVGGSVKVTFNAGMSDDWGGLPADLGQAVLLLAAHYYEYRHETTLSDGCMPFGVSSLIQRYRPMRIGIGAGQ